MSLSVSVHVTSEERVSQSFRENQNRHFMLDKSVPKIVLFIKQCGKKTGTSRQTTGDNITGCMLAK